MTVRLSPAGRRRALADLAESSAQVRSAAVALSAVAAQLPGARSAVARARGGLAGAQVRAVELEAELLQPVGHRPDAPAAVGAEVGERVQQHRIVVAQLVAADVEVLELARDGRQLGPGHAAQAVLARGGERLADAVDRVVVGEGHGPQARGRRVGDDVGGGEGAVGVHGVRLEIEVGADV